MSRWEVFLFGGRVGGGIVERVGRNDLDHDHSGV